MKKQFLRALFGLTILLPSSLGAQINQDKLGAWYIYFFNARFTDSNWGIQGDVQYRNWNLGGDLEQLLLRSGLTYRFDDSKLLVTLGYANITSGTYGSETTTTSESRIYQEALFPVQFGQHIFTTHRFRYEQRFVDQQDFRTRYRYNLFMNIPLNQSGMRPKTIYLALYNEVFLNGERNIGNDRSVAIFDRNRLYIAAGYIIRNGLKVQVGIMKQSTNAWQKNQLQLSVHHNF
ncbi:MAG: DUF2490 domain-containing protein [Bacteroidetes bacterium]|nr:DUF2490 domain-containing protein [Bacteroidota bacterium]